MHLVQFLLFFTLGIGGTADLLVAEGFQGGLLRNLVGLLLLLALAIGPASLLPAGSPAHTTLVVTSLALALAPLAVAAPATCARLCAALRVRVAQPTSQGQAGARSPRHCAGGIGES